MSKKHPHLPPLNLPPVQFKMKTEGETLKIFDSLRNKFVTLTPEEFVRQHFVNFLNKFLHYPESVMANEIGLELNGSRKRCDTVVFGPDMHPLVIVEYKSPEIQITQDVFDQIVRYNMELKARYLIVSNGLSHYCCRINYGSLSYDFLPRIPDYHDIINTFSSN